MDQFIAQFHSLTGTTIGERLKNLCHLLSQTKSTSDKLNFNLLEPKTELEEYLKIEILIYFERVDDLLQVLQNENPRLIKKVLSVKPGLFNKMFLEMDPNYLAKDFFLNLSFITKEKLLSKLAFHLNDVAKADLIFKAVKENYGMYLAAKLLPCCSQELISGYISLKVEITPSQMLLIVQRHPQLMVTVLEKLQKGHANKYSKVLKFIAQTNEDLFLNVIKTNYRGENLGWRVTEKLVNNHKGEVIKNADAVFKVAHKQQLYKSLGDDFCKFYVNLLPKTLAEFETNYNSYLNVVRELPTNFNKLDILISSFENKYGESLWNYQRFRTLRFMELMSQEQRAVWLKSRPIDISDDVWACLKPLEESIPELQRIIASTSSTEERAQLVGSLVETCRINGKNKGALLDVCKYVLKSHGNDDKIVVRTFLTTLKKCFVLDELDVEQWKCIGKMTDLMIAKKEHMFHCTEWLSDIVYFCYREKGPLKEQLKIYLKKCEYSNINISTSCKKQEGKFQKECYLLLGEVIRENYEKEEFKERYVSLLNEVMTWNKKHKDKIDITSFKQVDEFLVSHYESQTGYSALRENIIIPFAQKFDPKFDKLLDAYFNRKNIQIDLNIYIWFLKYRPLVIQRHIREITAEILSLWYTLIYSYFWKYSLNYTHLEIPQKMMEVCLEILNSNDPERKKDNVMPALSCLMESQKYLELITPYYPTESVMNLTNSDNKEKYELQQSITGSLKNLKPPSLAVESVLKFSQGDYLKYVQRSLYSVSHHSSEINLSNLFNSLADRAVSVRKHAIYLTFKVLNRTEIYKLVNHLMAREKNSSILKFLFKGTFRVFRQNPDDYLWSLVQNCARKLDKEDTECLEAILEVEKVPSDYVGKYVEFFSDFLSQFVQGEQLESGRLRLLKALTVTTIADLSKEFCSQIVEKEFLTQSLSDQRNHDEVLNDFVCKLIFCDCFQDELNERLGRVFEIFQRERTKGDCKSENNDRRFVFVQKFCLYFEEKKCSKIEILAKFVDMWKSIWKPHEALLEFLHLEYCLIWCNSQGGAKIAQLFNLLCTSYGVEILRIFSTYLQWYLCNAYALSIELPTERSSYDYFPIITGILRESQSINCLLLVILLLPTKATYLAPHKATYDQILDLLEQNTDPSIVLMLNSYYEEVQNLIVLPQHEKCENTYFNDYCPVNKYELYADAQL